VVLFRIALFGGQMKLARIIAPFSLSAVLFILSYLSLKDIESGFYSILLLIIGIALAAVGTAAIFSNK
jgi:hypothetical protein